MANPQRFWLAWLVRGAPGLRRAVNPNAPGAQPQSSAPKGGGGGEAQRSRRRGSLRVSWALLFGALRIGTHCRYAASPFCRASRDIFPQRGTSCGCFIEALLACMANPQRFWLAWQIRSAPGLRRAVNPNAPGAQPQSSAPKGGGGGEAQRSRRRGSLRVSWALLFGALRIGTHCRYAACPFCLASPALFRSRGTSCGCFIEALLACMANPQRFWLAWQTRGASGLRRAVNPNAPGAQPQ